MKESEQLLAWEGLLVRMWGPTRAARVELIGKEAGWSKMR